MKRWMEIEEYGRFDVEIELVTFDIPLLFVCKDSKMKRLLVLCVDEELGEYLAVYCSNEKLLEMLNNEIAMDRLFVEAMDEERILMKYDFVKKSFRASVICKNELTRDMLPDENAYFELKNDKIKKYIERLCDEGSTIIQCKFKRIMNEFESSRTFVYKEDIDWQDLSERKKISLVWIRYWTDGFTGEIGNGEDFELESLKPYVMRRSENYAI